MVDKWASLEGDKWASLEGEETPKFLAEMGEFKKIKERNPNLAEAFVSFLQALRGNAEHNFSDDTFDDALNWYDIIRDACRQAADDSMNNRTGIKALVIKVKEALSGSNVVALDKLANVIDSDSKAPPADTVTSVLEEIDTKLDSTLVTAKRGS